MLNRVEIYSIIFIVIGSLLFISISIFWSKRKSSTNKIKVKVPGGESIKIIIPKNPNKKELSVIRKKIDEEFILKEERVRGRYFDLKKNFIGIKGVTTIDIKDENGTTALLKQYQELKSLKNNVSKLSEIITSEGNIEPIFSSFDNIGIKSEEKFESGVYTISFEKPLNTGDIFKYQLEAKLKDSFTKPTEYWRIHTQIGFQKYDVKLLFPENRIPTKIDLFNLDNFQLKLIGNPAIKHEKTDQNYIVKISLPALNENNVHFLIEWQW